MPRDVPKAPGPAKDPPPDPSPVTPRRFDFPEEPGKRTVRNHGSTYSPRKGEVDKTWLLIDAEGLGLGHLAVEAARLLRGKHKPQFASHMDTGDYVVVVNAAKIELSGNKMRDKMFFRHSGRPGGLKATPYGELLARDPRQVVERAVRGMLPKNKLSEAQIKKLKVYAGPNHPHQAQQPRQHEIIQVKQ